MKIENIRFFSSLSDIEDVFDGNLDVSIKLKNHPHSYNVTVATPKNLSSLIKNEGNNFLSVGTPMIIVEKLTEDIITRALTSYAEEDDAYWLKFYAASLDVKTLDVLENRYYEREKLFHKLLDRNESIDTVNCSLIDFNLN